MNELVLPTQCGVMVLPDCTLFPHGGLPLYIFEPRYRKMLKQALETDCVFCLGRPLNPDDEQSQVAEIGTAGLIRACRERDDGTFELLLHGVIRVRFIEWLDEEYPCAMIEPLISDDLPDTSKDTALSLLKGAVEDVLGKLDNEVKIAIVPLLDLADDAALLADLVAQQLVADPNVRHELLETESVSQRISKLCDYLGQLEPEN